LLLSAIEENRRQVSRNTEAKKKSQLGQFLTPQRIAVFMASLFSDQSGHCRLLDAGAGIGSLSAAFLERWTAGELHFEDVDLVAFEIDPTLHPNLCHTFRQYASLDNFRVRIIGDDFIHASVGSLTGDLFSHSFPPYTHAILNPPYKKLNSFSAHRLALRRVGIETVNLYSAFVALALAQMTRVVSLWRLFRGASVMGHTTARFATSSLPGPPSVTCTFSNREAKRSRMTTSYRKTSSSCWSEAAGRGR